MQQVQKTNPTTSHEWQQASAELYVLYEEMGAEVAATQPWAKGNQRRPEMTTITATPTKLRSGEWGAKVQGTVRQGDTITITTRAGKSWTASVAKVVWRGEGVAIVATRSKPNGRNYRRERGYCYYPCSVDGHVCSPENGPCHDCI